jgi:ABC transporter substrate binding protein
MIDRGTFLAGMGAVLLAAPLAAGAQQAGKVYRIGWLALTPPSSPDALWEAFIAGLRERGYVEGQNIVLERRYSEGREDRFPGYAAELVQMKVDVIVAESTQAARAAKAATSSIRIVFVGILDPERTALVASLGRPGGNVTGSRTRSLRCRPSNSSSLRKPCPASLVSPSCGIRRMKHRHWHGERLQSRRGRWAWRRSPGQSPAPPNWSQPWLPWQLSARMVSTSTGAVPETDHRIRLEPTATDVRPRRPSMGGRRCASNLWPQLSRHVSARRRLHRYDSQGVEARRPPRRATHQVRARHQPQDRQGPRPDDPAISAGAGGSSNRVMRRRAFLFSVCSQCSPRRSPLGRSRRGRCKLPEASQQRCLSAAAHKIPPR